MPQRRSRDEVAALCRALAHPIRLGVVERLEDGPLSPTDYATARNKESLGTVAHHFRTLERAGLIEVASTEQRRGALKHYYRLTRRGRKLVGALKRL